MKKIVYYFAILIAITLFSSCENTNEPEVITLEDGIYLGVCGDLSGVVYDVQNSRISPIGFTDEASKVVLINNHSFTVVYENTNENVIPFVCVKSKLTKNDYQAAIPGDKNKEFFGLHFLYNNKMRSFNNGLFMAIREASQPGFYDVTLVGMNGRYEKTTATIATENDHQKMSFNVSPVISHNYENDNEVWNVTFGEKAGYEFGSNVLFISEDSPVNFRIPAVTIYN